MSNEIKDWLRDNAVDELQSRIAELERIGETRQDILEIQEARIDELESRIHEAQEVYAGMEGFIPVHASEAYLQRIIDQMYKALLGGGENG